MNIPESFKDRVVRLSSEATMHYNIEKFYNIVDAEFPGAYVDVIIEGSPACATQVLVFETCNDTIVFAMKYGEWIKNV